LWWWWWCGAFKKLGKWAGHACCSGSWQSRKSALAETAHAKQRVSGTLCTLQSFSQQGVVLKNFQRLSPTLMERSVFFEGAVPVRLQQYDREERMADLTVHVLQAASGAGRAASLRFQLSDEADPFFYYWMEIDEESFQALKSEQCIMVDFSTFPSKVVEMLEASKSSSFECRLIVTTSSSRFEIVETNAFKKIVHLSLVVAHGDDAEVKKYLADKWILTKNSLLHMTQQHEQLAASSSMQIQQLVRVLSQYFVAPPGLVND
jgi:hypothetical protein